MTGAVVGAGVTKTGVGAVLGGSGTAAGASGAVAVSSTGARNEGRQPGPLVRQPQPKWECIQ
jgi:hypothetical protein